MVASVATHGTGITRSGAAVLIALVVIAPLAALIAVPWYGMTHGYDLWQWGSFLLLWVLQACVFWRGWLIEVW